MCITFFKMPIKLLGHKYLLGYLALLTWQTKLLSITYGLRILWGKNGRSKYAVDREGLGTSVLGPSLLELSILNGIYPPGLESSKLCSDSLTLSPTLLLS